MEKDQVGLGRVPPIEQLQTQILGLFKVGVLNLEYVYPLGLRRTKPGATKYGVKLMTAFGLCHSVTRMFKIFIIIVITIASSLIALYF